MEYLLTLLPKIEFLGAWSYWILLLISILESTAFVGLVIPGTTAAIFTGFLASRHIIDLGDAIWFMAIGGIIGDTISFYLGRKSKELQWLQNNKLLRKEHLLKAEKFFNDHGDKSVITARFIGPLRPIIPFVAGLFQMPARRFFLYNIVGGIVSTISFIYIGYFFGEVYNTYHYLFRRIEGGILIVLATLIVGYFINKQIIKE